MVDIQIPHSVLAGGWIPFTVVVVLTLIFAWVYIRLFQHNELSEVSSSLVAVLGLFVVLLTTAVVPVDVFLVSYMKTPNGTFKAWAADNVTRSSVEATVTYTYYTLYGLVALFVFFLLPFMYFYYEEKDDDEVSTKQRCCTGLKYTIGFLVAAFIILLTGALVPLKTPKNIPDMADKFNYLKHELEQYTKPQQAISIMVGCMSMLGMLTLVMYTGYGMSALPLGMIRCCGKYKAPEDDEQKRRLSRRERDQERARMIRAKQNSGRNLTRFERNELHRIEANERLDERVARRKNKMKRNCCGRILLFLKPFEVVFGFAFLGISLLIMASLTVTSIDKAMHSLGPKAGYALPKPHLPNPINFVMVYAQKVFPLDYVLFSGMALFFIFASMSGLKRMGIWCCCIKMYKVRIGRTMPQALIFMVFIMMFMVLALNIVLFTVSPQYVQYGNQKYQANVTETHPAVNGTGNVTTWRMETMVCTTSAPEGECLMSRLALLLNTLFYKAWFFGAFFYWAMWGFVGMFYLGLFVSLWKMCRTKPETEMVSSSDSDADSDTSLIRA